jgi:hypothetical protein
MSQGKSTNQLKKESVMNENERFYIPVLQIGADRYIVFVTRWEGETYFARSLQYLKHRIIFPTQDRFWHTASREAALTLVKTSMGRELGWNRGLGSELTPRAVSFPVTELF